MKNKKTTVAGIAAIVAAVAGAIAAQWDNDPATVADWATVIATLTVGVGLLFAGDGKKD